MDRDLRGTPSYEGVERHVRRIRGPAFGRVSEPSDPAPSPDGSTIAFAGEVFEGLEGTPRHRICAVDATGGAVRELTASTGDDLEPRWSPDGRWLSFRSDRKERGRSQLDLLDPADPGEPRALPEIPGSVELHSWAPDGRRILAVAAGIGADRAGAAGSGTTTVAREDPSWLPEVESRANRAAEWRRLWVIDVLAGTVTLASPESMNIWEADWCGTAAVAAIASDDPGEGAWYRASLVRIDLSNEAADVLLRSDVQLGLPAGSPDGRWVAAVEAICSDRLTVAGDLVLVDVEAGTITRIDASKVDVTCVVWRDDSTLFAMGLRDLDGVALEIDASAGSASETWSTTSGYGFWYPAGRPTSGGFVTAPQSHGSPPEIVLVDHGGERSVASFRHAGNDYVQSVSGMEERLRWTAPDGLEIQGYLVSPDRPGPHPLIAWIHGGPVWAHQSSWPGELTSLLVARGFALLLPNPRGSAGRGRAFAERVYGDPGGAEATDTLSGIDALVGRGVADPERVGVMGASHGGYMACWLPVVDRRFAAAVAISPATDLYSSHFESNIGEWDAEFLRAEPDESGGMFYERSPVFFADRVRTPTLLTAGLRDRCTPPGQAVEFYRALRRRDVPTEVVVYPEEGHGVEAYPARIDHMTRILAWFERFMPAHHD